MRLRVVIAMEVSLETFASRDPYQENTQQYLTVSIDINLSIDVKKNTSSGSFLAIYKSPYRFSLSCS